MNSPEPLSIDYNIDHYTLSNLLLILGVDSPDDTEAIETITQQYIETYEEEENDDMAQFFRDMQNRLLEPDDKEEKIQQQWFQNANALPQSDIIQRDKNTDRQNKIQVYNSDHVPMNREHIGITNTLSVPVSQDTMNPNLKNITTRYINIDSQYRQATNGQDNTPTDFTMDLSEPLNNVLSLKLYSIQIPYTWYSLDNTIGNTYFWISFVGSGVYYTVNVAEGNYSPDEFVSAVNASFSTDNGWDTTFYPLKYCKHTGKVSFKFPSSASWTKEGHTYPIVSGETQIVFYDVYGYLPSMNAAAPQKTIDQTLGWLMGFRLPYILIDIDNGNKADTLIDLYGPRYLILAIDDYNQNHINSGVVTITEISKKIKLPSYYNPSIPVKYTDPLANNLSANIENVGDNGYLLMDKLNLTNKIIPQVLPTAPRILTQAQIYSINEIMKNNEQNTQYRSRPPSSSDIFALIPVKHGDTIGSVMIELTSSLQENKRVYFGPVNIERLRIRWYDDKGNILNTNGADWSITVIAELLYQY